MSLTLIYFILWVAFAVAYAVVFDRPLTWRERFGFILFAISLGFGYEFLERIFP